VTLTGAVGTAAGQNVAPAAGKLPGVNYTHATTYHLPVGIDKNERAHLREIRLYCRTPTTNWKLQESGNQSLERFSCNVEKDGEYWYTSVIVDREGRMVPADPTQVPPQQRVIVDTTPPVIRVQSGQTADGELCLRCVMEDANPDPGTLKAVCKTDMGDIPLEGIPGQPGTFRLKGGNLLRHPVEVSGFDLAQNRGSKEVNVGELIASTLGATPKAPPPAELALASGRPDANPGPLSPPPRVENPAPVTRADSPPRLDPPPKLDPPPRLEGPGKVADQLPNGSGNRLELPLPSALNPMTTPAQTAPPTAPLATTQMGDPKRGSTPYQLINTTHASVEYKISELGPSGISRVEIYMTPDGGQSWHRLAEDADKRSPAEINLPGDGVYGIRIVLTNGNGFGGHPPRAGDNPHCMIEVDTSCPFVQLRSPELNPSAGHVEIKWVATDKNLGATPINLYYRARVEGKWELIARDLKNDGLYRWSFPRDISSQVTFKIEVADLAGNLSHDVSRQPLVIDVAEPRISVVGVSGNAKQ
jgi:hypothetical protein